MKSLKKHKLFNGQGDENCDFIEAHLDGGFLKLKIYPFKNEKDDMIITRFFTDQNAMRLYKFLTKYVDGKK